MQFGKIRLVASLLVCGFVLGGSASQAQQAAKPASKPVDFSKDHTLYVIGYSHLDTEWRWSYPQVIREFLPNTLHDNFALFEKYPDYIFNWTGSNRYRLMKEYYPEDFKKLKAYVAAGRWFPNGSNVEEGDVDMPSEESIIRQILYGNQFYRREFGVASDEFMIPDCFGFPASLPSIFAHAGLTGFSTQKLTWGSAVGIPFNVGVWEGPDGQSVIAALNPGSYTSSINDDLSNDQGWIGRVNDDGAKSGVFVDYSYFGTGDRGGAPGEDSVKWMEKSLKGAGPLQVRAAKANEMFDKITPDQRAKLPRYKGDLLLTHHSAGSLSSQAAMKRWNRKNELLADAAERASVAADWLGSAPYDRARLSDAWLRFLPGQFHDLMAGTALPKSYEFAWNDQVLALNEFAGVLNQAAGGVVRGLDTRAKGVSLVVYNPLSIARQDVVEASVLFPGGVPKGVRVVGPDGKEVPSQLGPQDGNSVKVLFLANAPSVGFATYDVRPAGSPGKSNRALKVTASGVENARYRVTLNSAGDIASIFDKAAKKEMLASPARLAFLHENPAEYPAWNMDWEDQSKPPRAYVDGPATIKVVEDGPVRAAIQVERTANGSHFIQTIRLAGGEAGNRVEIANNIDWKSQECALKAVFPLTVANPEATYNWELGTIQRSSNDPKKFEVPSHRWFDLTDTSGQYGVSVLDDCKYGSDKPDDNTVRLTLLYTPGVRGGYQDQATQDWGRHEFVYALQGHIGDWREGNTQWEASRLNQPLIAFQTPAHDGPLGTAFSLLNVNSPQVSVEALKKAEDSDEVIVRFNELSGKPAQNVRFAMAAPILSAREVNGQEQPLGGATVLDGKLAFSMDAYRPRAFALKLGPAPSRFLAPQSVPLDLPYDTSVTSSAPGQTDGKFDSVGNALPAEMLPAAIGVNGVVFRLGPTGTGQKNAVTAAGQTLTLPAGKERRLYFLAASTGSDTPATFQIDGKPTTLNIQSWDSPVGQWDTRLWKGEVRELTYDWPNPIAGLTPGYIKRTPVAWYSDHKRLANGQNDPYGFCYLFQYAIPVPDSAKAVQLPSNASVRIIAASVAQNPNADTLPAQPLYDVLDRTGGRTPEIVAPSVATKDAVQVSMTPPLYYADGLRYTLDGTTPDLTSPVYTEPLTLSKTTVVKTAELDEGGQPGPVTSKTVEVHDVTPPTLLSAAASPFSPTVTSQFSEPLDRVSAESAANYNLSPADQVQSVTLGADNRTVTLTLAAPLAGASTLTVTGVRDLSPQGNVVAPGTTRPIDIARPIFALKDIQTFDGKGNGFQKTDVADLPAKGTDPWTINLFVYTDTQPGELTLLGGFGDGSDSDGQERYIIEYKKGIEFWGSNVDIASGLPFDLGKWQMVTATFDGQTVRLYKNGVEIKSGAATLSDAQPVVKLAPSGPWDNGHKFSGKIQDFTIWNRVLDPAFLHALLASGPQ
jgi:alpha-mannosidase